MKTQDQQQERKKLHAVPVSQQTWRVYRSIQERKEKSCVRSSGHLEGNSKERRSDDFLSTPPRRPLLRVHRP